MDDRAFGLFSSFLPQHEEAFTKYVSVDLIDLVNLTDFIDLERLFSLYHVDRSMDCIHKLTESTNAKEAEQRDKLQRLAQIQAIEDMQAMVRGERQEPKEKYHAEKKAKTVYVRTVRDIEGDFQLLFFFSLFGVQWILNDDLEKAQTLYARICEVKKILDDPRSEKKLSNAKLVDALKQLRTILGQSEDLIAEYRAGYERAERPPEDEPAESDLKPAEE